MSFHAQKIRAEVYDHEYVLLADEAHPELRQIAAAKLQPFRRHLAGGGSEYIYIGETFKIRFADHENVSSRHGFPNINCVDRDLAEDEIADIRAQIDYPALAKKTALAKHVGLTVPKLKKLLNPDCYESIVPDPFSYPNTTYEMVRVLPALAAIRAAGIETCIPISQEAWTEEDYDGGRWR